MSRILLIGATGGVGRRLHPRLTAAGHEVVALHRKPDQAQDLRAAGCEPVLDDLMEMTAEDIAAAADGCDVIVFSAGAAGSGHERTERIDGGGPVRALEAAGRRGVRRFYLVSAFMDALRGGEAGEGFEFYMAMKRAADVAVAASALDWLILRPGTLTDGEGTGVNAGLAVPQGEVARDSVAAMLAALIETPAVTREIIEMIDGPTPVTDAVARLRR